MNVSETLISKEMWQVLHQDLEVVGVSLPTPDTFETQMNQLYEALLAYNEHTNLTRLTSPDDFLRKLVLDSLLLLPFLPENATLADVGSGAGFPALPVALARPDVRVSALESVAKKCTFMTQMRDTLAPNLEVLNHRSESLAREPQYRDQFDVVTAKAVASLPVLLELTLPLVRPGGQFLAIKGLQSYEAELEKSERALSLLQGEFLDALTFPEEILPNTVLLLFAKMEATPPAFPRKLGMAAKSPL